MKTPRLENPVLASNVVRNMPSLPRALARTASDVPCHPPGQVRIQLDHLATAVDGLERELGRLAEVLGPALAAYPEGVAPPKDAEEVLVPIADSLRGRVRHLNRLVGNLGHIIDSVQL